jgi:hypothetical protein
MFLITYGAPHRRDMLQVNTMFSIVTCYDKCYVPYTNTICYRQTRCARNKHDMLQISILTDLISFQSPHNHPLCSLCVSRITHVSAQHGLLQMGYIYIYICTTVKPLNLQRCHTYTYCYQQIKIHLQKKS